MVKTCSLVQYVTDRHWPSEPFVFKHRSFDIPTTIARTIMALPANCVAIGLNTKGGPVMIRAAERAARKRGLRILWRNL